MNRRGFIQAVMAAAVATYTGLPKTQPLTPGVLELLPERFTAHVWIEDGDGRALTERGVLRMRRTAPMCWKNEGTFQATMIETGIAKSMYCEIEGQVSHFDVGVDNGLQLDNRYFSTGGAISITSMTMNVNSS